MTHSFRTQAFCDQSARDTLFNDASFQSLALLLEF
jgi:hypothetical protein